MAIDSVTYLNNIANCTTNNVLRSQYYIKCTIPALKEGVKLPVKFKTNLSRCLKCLIPYAELTKYTVQPIKHTNKKIKQPTCERKKNNVMIIECHFCRYKMKNKMEKPIKLISTQINEELNKNLKKKKKRRKDKFSGLNENAVLAVTPKSWQPKPELTPQKTKADLWKEKNEKVKLKHAEKFQKRKEANHMKKKLNQLSNLMKTNDSKKGAKGLKDFLSVLCNK